MECQKLRQLRQSLGRKESNFTKQDKPCLELTLKLITRMLQVKERFVLKEEICSKAITKMRLQHEQQLTLKAMYIQETWGNMLMAFLKLLVVSKNWSSQLEVKTLLLSQSNRCFLESAQLPEIWCSLESSEISFQLWSPWKLKWQILLELWLINFKMKQFR